jgi:hypothetical protein
MPLLGLITAVRYAGSRSWCRSRLSAASANAVSARGGVRARKPLPGDTGVFQLPGLDPGRHSESVEVTTGFKDCAFLTTSNSEAASTTTA